MTSPSFDEVIDRRGTHSLKWTRYWHDVLPLWVADMDFRAPEPARQALQAAINHGIFGYELPSRKLAETVAARMERLYRWSISPEMVVATPGIVAGFKAAARAVCKSGEGVLVQPPVYHPFLEVPEHTGTVGQLAPLQPIKKQHTLRYAIDWQFFEGSLNSNGTRTAMFLLCHPHNPTGRIFNRPELERMADICLRNNTVICSDEIHSELLLGGTRHIPLASLGPEIAQRTITLVSPSKTFNLVGLFCGFAIIPDPKLRASYRRVIRDLALHVNSLGLIAAEAALSGACDSWLEELRRYLTANRDYLVDFVTNELEGVRVTVPDATYLAWLDFGDLVRDGRITGNPYQFFLDKAKVALNPGIEFGPEGEHFVRLNFGCPRSILTEALQRIKGAIAGQPPAA
ncbi:MAG TPA: MalY/PatB family protein [Clostridia bacterium]|nr:MalY/PatB family protein [Clostridia bacterium]